MKHGSMMVFLLLVTLLLAGCSQKTARAEGAQVLDFGGDVADGKSITKTLANGVTCTVTTTLLPNGNVKLATKLQPINAAGTNKTLVFEIPNPGKPITYAVDSNTEVTINLSALK